MRARTVTAVLAALLPGLIVVDFVNGALGQSLGLDKLPASPGELVRGVVFAIALALAFASWQRELRPMLLGFLAVALTLGPGFLRGLTSGGGLGEFDRMFKLLYGPVLVVFYARLFRRHGVELNTILQAEAVMGAIAGASIVMLQAVGVGRATYGQYSSAFAGLFIAQNDIGLTMSLTLFAATDRLASTRRLVWVLCCGLIMVGMLVLGTRTGTLGALAVPMAVFWLHRREFAMRSRLPAVIAMLLVLVGGLALAAMRQYQVITSEGYQERKYTSLFEGEMPRAVLLAGALKYVVTRPRSADVIGDGTVKFQQAVARALGMQQTRKEVELDWMDLFGGYGVIGLVGVYFYYLVFFWRCFRLRRMRVRGAMQLFLLMLGFFVLHATMAGHAMGSPLAAGAMAPVLAFLWLALTSERLVSVAAPADAGPPAGEPDDLLSPVG